MGHSAEIRSYQAATVPTGARKGLACLYVVVDPRSDRSAIDVLADGGACCDGSTVDWHGVRRPRSALVGIELGHSCDRDRGSLRLVFDVVRDADALTRLAETGVLAVGTRALGSFANVCGTYRVDAAEVGETIAAARASLDASAASIAS
jgi:hypothetical protein